MAVLNPRPYNASVCAILVGKVANRSEISLQIAAGNAQPRGQVGVRADATVQL